MQYTKHVNARETVQTQPIPGRSDQVKNSAGGFVFDIGPFGRFERFLILGSEGGSYYANEQKLTRENAKSIEACLKLDGIKAVNMILSVSVEGRAPKNDPAIFALGMALKLGNETTRKAAAAAVPKVCRTGTHLLQLAEVVKNFGGWGRVTTRAFASWFTEQTADQVAYQLAKYQSRNGWSMADLLTKSHAGSAAPTEAHHAAFRWATRRDMGERKVIRSEGKGTEKTEAVTKTYAAINPDAMPRILVGMNKAKDVTTAKEVIQLINEYELPREMIPTQFLNDKGVWEALLNAGKGMPLTALIRNLGKMTSIGLIGPNSEASRTIVKRLADADDVRKARLHPMTTLVAMRQYNEGRGDKGSLTWSPDKRVIDALDGAFYLGFKAVKPTGLRWMLALDVSGSMGAMIANMKMSAREASAAMALVTANVEDAYHMVAYTAAGGSWHNGQNAVEEFDVSPRMRLTDVTKKMEGMNFGRTDCALPILYALEKKIPVDVFASYTDNETYAGKVHVSQALRMYREKMGINAKLIAVGMTATSFSVVDPKDPGSLDVVGFDTNAPAAMAAFAVGA